MARNDPYNYLPTRAVTWSPLALRSTPQVARRQHERRPAGRGAPTPAPRLLRLQSLESSSRDRITAGVLPRGPERSEGLVGSNDLVMRRSCDLLIKATPRAFTSTPWNDPTLIIVDQQPYAPHAIRIRSRAAHDGRWQATRPRATTSAAHLPAPVRRNHLDQHRDPRQPRLPRKHLVEHDGRRTALAHELHGLIMARRAHPQPRSPRRAARPPRHDLSKRNRSDTTCLPTSARQ